MSGKPLSITAQFVRYPLFPHVYDSVLNSSKGVGMTKTYSKFISVLKGEILSSPPIWFMRQAGRYLPEYRAVREEAGGFLDLCYDPEKAARVTMQPIERFDLDAAILFADILLIPQSMGQSLWFEKGEGPRLAPSVSTSHLSFEKDANPALLDPVYETVRKVRAELDKDKALIGFAGAPWTVATYMINGKGSKDPSALRLFAYQHPEIFDKLIRQLTENTVEYLDQQISAGADAVMLFDSWATGLPQRFFDEYCRRPAETISAELKKRHPEIPFIAFPRGAGPLYTTVAKSVSVDCISIDTGLPWSWVSENLSPHATVQGGMDQLLLIEGGEPMLTSARELINCFAGKPFIFNAGHGLIPETPPEHVAQLVSFIRSL